MKTKFFPILLLVIGVCISMLTHSCVEEPIDSDETSNSTYDTELKKEFNKYEIVQIDFQNLWQIAKEKPTSSINYNFGFENHPNWEFSLVSDDLNELIPETTKFYEIGDNHQLNEVPKFESLALVTEDSKMNDKKASIIMSLGQLEAEIFIENEAYYLQPLSDFVKEAPVNSYVLYNLKDIIYTDVSCNLKSDKSTSKKTNIIGSTKRIGYVYTTLLGDYQTYKKFQNIEKTIKYMSNRLYFTNRMHKQNGSPFRFRVHNTYVYSNYGQRNYPSTRTYSAYDFNEDWATYYQESWFGQGDINYCVTGKRINDPQRFIGYAYQDQVCAYPDYAFGFGSFRRSRAVANTLMAHETGHILGAEHETDSYNNIMYPIIYTGYYFSNLNIGYFNWINNNQGSCL